MRKLSHSLVISLLCFATACSSGGGNGAGDGVEIVPNGKADNYYSNLATEYEVAGTVNVAMTKAEFADETLRNQRINGRLTAVGLYLTALVTDKFEGIDKNNDGQITEDEIFFRNVGYGGFFAMVRNFSVEPGDVTAAGDGYDVHFTIDMGGPANLLSTLPKAPDVDAPAGAVGFELRMPAGKTVNPEDVPRTEIRNFNPDTYAGALETHALVAKALDKPGNAFPDYADFFADGVLDVTMFYGYDYNAARTDLQESEEAFYVLTEELGFKAPVKTYAELTAESGPFTKNVRANGELARIEVRIFTEPMFIGNRKAQHDLALSEITTRDVFFYNGHAGPYYGFYLDEAKAAQVNYNEFRTAPFTDKQQLVIAQGCQTYSQYADSLYANDVKSEANLDVITTVNYSYGIGTTELLSNLVRTDADGRHEPVDFYAIVSDLNDEWWNEQKQVFYGVMGIDGNPQLHPYANVETIGTPCEASADCGDITGNVCASFGGAKICAAKAVAESACPAGTTFGNLGRSGSLTSGACY